MAMEEKDYPELKKPMTTAKDLAFKAFCYNLPKDVDYSTSDIKERFENWWSEWYGREEHRDGFYHKHSVFIDLKRFIQAE